ncbi:50S ribosomal protein L4 [Fodinibius sediminis]|uniref:Large ribosomal subunit protein uL4 n=1 Tax=Fodinibius sediminis TaxID=1214077 RepID=A0A521FC54_9BACT|nr:50S ribosomal protein L4 [Fodinibius sediminis]SMO93782.1 large subunit ribosomal protein L4 [Fodinibius sediminis]
MKLPIYTVEGEDSGNQAELAESIFAIEPNETVIYEDVRRYMANQRQGTAKTKERGEVRGGGRKAYRQKGTGQARRGSIRSPLLKGGGTVFGPKPRDYSFRMSKKSRQLARKSALSLKAGEDAIKVVNDFSFDEPKTRKVVDILDGLGIENKKVLILTAETDKIIYKSARNIPNISVLEANKPTTYQILDADVILVQQSAVDVLQGSIEPVEEVEA